MVEGFTNKEMLVRIIEQVDCFEKKVNGKIDKLNSKISDTHDLALETNGKVKLHEKLIFALGGTLIGIIGWIISKLL